MYIHTLSLCLSLSLSISLFSLQMQEEIGDVTTKLRNVVTHLGTDIEGSQTIESMIIGRTKYT